eukprot:1838007-Alexandrium_andersonii.AAC.1
MPLLVDAQDRVATPFGSLKCWLLAPAAPPIHRQRRIDPQPPSREDGIAILAHQWAHLSL